MAFSRRFARSRRSARAALPCLPAIASFERDSFTRPIDNFNLRLNRARSDADRPHVFNSSVIYTLPVGRNRRFGGKWPRWLDSALGGWDTGGLAIWESGSVFSVRSGRR